MEVDPGRVYSGTRKAVWAVFVSKWIETLRIVVSTWWLKVTKKFHQLKWKSNFLTQTEKEQGLSYRHICYRMFKSLSDDLHYLKLSLTLSTRSHHGFLCFFVFFVFFFCYSFLCLSAIFQKVSASTVFSAYISQEERNPFSLNDSISPRKDSLPSVCPGWRLWGTLCAPVHLCGRWNGHISIPFYGICCYRLVCKSCLALWDPMNCNLPCSSVHGISQARILECSAISFCKRSFQPRDWTWHSCIVGGFFTIWVTWTALIWHWKRSIPKRKSQRGKWTSISTGE